MTDNNSFTSKLASADFSKIASSRSALKRATKEISKLVKQKEKVTNRLSRKLKRLDKSSDFYSDHVINMKNNFKNKNLGVGARALSGARVAINTPSAKLKSLKADNFYKTKGYAEKGFDRQIQNLSDGLEYA